MTLILTILRSPDQTVETRHLEDGEFSIGRGNENDLVLPDPERHLSKRHCLLKFRHGAWHVADLSANGTFHNRDEEPLGPGAPRELKDGDRLRIGLYQIGIRLPGPDPRTTRPPATEAPAGAPVPLLGDFLAGAGIPGLVPADPASLMRSLGRATRAMVAGLRAALGARAVIKEEFRIEQTMVRARGNNPLKFAADDEEALVALLGGGRRGDMDAAAAITEALRDMRLHELASVTAMQAAVRALIEQFDPARLRDRADGGGGLTVLPAQRKARAWDAFERLHEEIRRALADDFDSVFGKAYAEAYEAAIRETRAQETRGP